MSSPYQVNFANPTPLEQTLRLKEIKEMLTLASSYSGKVYGGFVRDVIVPRMFEPKCPVNFKDVDIWFRFELDAINFVNAMDKKLTTSYPGGDGEYPGSPGKFTRQKYYLMLEDIKLVCIDVVVAEKLPVDDFDVNTLLFRVTNNEYVTDNSPGSDFLIKRIKDKRAIMYPTYQKKLNDRNLNTFFRERVGKLLDKGWKLHVLTDNGDFEQFTTTSLASMGYRYRPLCDTRGSGIPPLHEDVVPKAVQQRIYANFN